MYNVIGGVWADTSFTDIVEGTQEEYGPFERYEDAYSVWRGRMGLMIDTCEHRLFIVQVGPSLTDPDSDCAPSRITIEGETALSDWTLHPGPLGSAVSASHISANQIVFGAWRTGTDVTVIEGDKIVADTVHCPSFRIVHP